MTPESSTHSVFLLKASESTTAPYLGALDVFGGNVLTFDRLENLLLAAEGRTPLAVIVDLDVLERVQTTVLEQIRAVFSSSELIALSRRDSSQVALVCLRSGFSDFLLKPVSPEELTWSLRKCLQKRELARRPPNPKTRMLGALSDLATSTSPAVLRLMALRHAQSLLGAKGAAWIVTERDEPKILCSVPKRPHASSDWAAVWKLKVTRPSRTLVNRRTSERRVLLRGQDPAFGGIYLWGITQRVSTSALAEARAVLEHAELNLMHLIRVAEIRRQTFLDDLTGLYNSRYLKFALQNAVTQCKAGQSFTVLFIDVDRFKSVNDQHGHPVGSELLVALARTIRNAVRSADSVFRYGGDEFIVLLQNAGLDKAREIAERLRRHIERRTFLVQRQALKTTVSIGIAVYPLHASKQDALLNLADQAMYSAKRHSRNSVHLAIVEDGPSPEISRQPEI